MHTLEGLISDIRNLGVSDGDTLLVHSSYNSLGKMEKGAETIVRSLQLSVTYDGLLLMPSFNMTKEGAGNIRSETWDIEESKSTVGWITEYFRKLPETSRSDHYSHSVAGWGRGAIPFLSGHSSHIGPKSPWDRDPWGKTYGLNSPFYRSYDQLGKIIMIGDIPWSSCTHIHFIETLYWNTLLESDSDSPYPKLKSEMVGEYLKHRYKKGFLDDKVNVGKIGDANCIIFQIRKFVDIVLEKLVESPDIFLKKR